MEQEAAERKLPGTLCRAVLPHGGRVARGFRFRAASCRRVAERAGMGHGNEHGHGHGPSKMELPDYRQWKIEGTPLEQVQERLARRGLRDPWARNEAWRYMGGFAKPVTLTQVLTKGFKWGFAAFVIALGIEYAMFPPKKNGGHH